MTARTRYTRTARWLHWIVAALVIANLALGFLHDVLRPVAPGAMLLHKAIGFTVLALMMLRLAWRVRHAPPPLPATLPHWQRRSAGTVHGLFYAFLLATPLLGWVLASASPKPLAWFGLFALPKLPVTKSDWIVQASRTGHDVLGLALGVLLLVHVGAVLHHRFRLRDGLLRRMLGH